jgi:hypothetical protein
MVTQLNFKYHHPLLNIEVDVRNVWLLNEIP